jgi:hypothetical protein
VKPLFVFSLPRSGSTLVQRILAVSGEISTASEPWLLLPFIYTFKPGGMISEYGHRLSVDAIRDFYKGFPRGKKDYTDALSYFIMTLYRKRSNAETRYFLDKTPRYHLICDEIINLFPDGKFIFLARNPLAVAASMINSWYEGKWKLAACSIDLYDGMRNLLDTYSANKTIIHPIQYEKLIQDPAGETRKIGAYLDLDFTDEMISSFNHMHFSGRMGDKIGTAKYASINNNPRNSWIKTFNNPIRRNWARRYLKWIGAENLKIMGYDHIELKSALNGQKGLHIESLCHDLLIELVLKTKITLSPLGIHHNKPFKYLYR